MAAMRCVEAILAAVERIPGAKLEIDARQRSAGVRVGARLVAHIDLRHGRVLVNVPTDTIPTLRRAFPSSRPSAKGIVFDAVNARACSEAVAAIRRRVTMERLAPQLRVASP